MPTPLKSTDLQFGQCAGATTYSTTATLRFLPRPQERRRAWSWATAGRLVQRHIQDGSFPWPLQSVPVSSHPAPKASPALSPGQPAAYAASLISCPYLLHYTSNLWWGRQYCLQPPFRRPLWGRFPTCPAPSHNTLKHLISLKTLSRPKQKQSNSLTRVLLWSRENIYDTPTFNTIHHNSSNISIFPKITFH
jgi:hypothetical protein